MKRIVLISCVSKKLGYRTKAEALYVSPLFLMALAFARSLRPDKIFILSAKYGLVDLDQEIEPYEQTLNTMSGQEIKRWAEGVIKQMEGKVDCSQDEAIFLAGDKYRKHLLPNFRHAQVPLKNLRIGEQLGFLKRALADAK